MGTGEGHEDIPHDPVDVTKSPTRGVLGGGSRTGPGLYATTYQSGPGTAAHFKDETQPKNISGYSGFIPKVCRELCWRFVREGQRGRCAAFEEYRSGGEVGTD